MKTLLENTDFQYRLVTQIEVERYRDDGWVRLNNLISPEMAGRMLARAKATMGEDGDSNAPCDEKLGIFNVGPTQFLKDAVFLPLIPSLGVAAKALMEGAGRTGVRYLTDLFAVKLPACRDTLHGGNQRTPLHNDFVTWAVDRAGGLSVWIALADLTPEMGTLEFLSGSQSRGPLSSYRVLGDGDITDLYPDLTERFPTSGPQTLKAGDAIVYSTLCVHGAGPNRTDDPRWVYIMSCVPADVCWNGAKGELFCSDGMQQFDPLIDEARFPLIAT